MEHRVLGRILTVLATFSFFLLLCQPSIAATNLRPEYDDWADQQPASLQLKRITDDAYRVSDIASNLQGMDPYEVGWRIYATNLDRIRFRVDSMNAMLSELRTDGGDVSPAERKEIREITPSVIDLAATTSASLKSVDKHQAYIGFGHMQTYAGNLYNLSAQVSHAAGS